MSDHESAGPATPGARAETARMVLSMTVACGLGALVLGAVFVATDRYATSARIRREHAAIVEMLSLPPSAPVREISQYLDREHDRVVYRWAGTGAEPDLRLVFALDGTLVERAPATAAGEARTLEPLGRIFVAGPVEVPEGFVVEGETRGYKNVIRFFVALDSSFAIAGVRVVEHEEDPGLGAEAATRWFQGQYIGRGPDGSAALELTRDPMPEDWRAALAALDRQPVAGWRAAHAALIAREGARPIYAVTGATITSRALTDGVRATIDHFRRRWALLAPQLGGAS